MSLYIQASTPENISSNQQTPFIDSDSQSQEYSELSIAGSVTIEPVLKAWAKTLLQQHPNLNISIISSGSNSAPIALAEGIANIGSMSRRMASDENDFIHTQQEASIIREHLIAFDALTIIVHPSNPINRLTALQVDQLFSASQRCVQERPSSLIKKWGTLLTQTIPLSQRKVQTMGRFSNSGTYRWFRENALCGGMFRPDMQAFPSHGAIIQAVQNSPSAIAYIGSAYLTAGVKALSIEPTDQTTEDTSNDDNYSAPLTRPLFLYTIHKSDADDQEVTAKTINLLLALIYSPKGQAIAKQAGLEPLDDQQLEQYKKLIINP